MWNPFEKKKVEEPEPPKEKKLATIVEMDVSDPFAKEES